MQEMEAHVVDGNSTEAGHVIVTTIGGKNGQPKQVSFCYFICCMDLWIVFVYICIIISALVDVCNNFMIVDNKLHG
jgi:hypothetical protein